MKLDRHHFEELVGHTFFSGSGGHFPVDTGMRPTFGAVHGVEASLLAKGSVLKLRAAFLGAVCSRRQPLASAGAALSMLDGP